MSGFGFLATLALWAISYHQHPWYDGRRIAGDVRAGVFSGWFWLFNTESPYQGSIISVSSPNGPPPVHPKRWGLNLPGIYVRYFAWPNETVWSAGVSLAYPAIASSVGSLLLVGRASPSNR